MNTSLTGCVVGTELLPAFATNFRTASRLDGGPLQFKKDDSEFQLTTPNRKRSRPVFLGVKWNWIAPRSTYSSSMPNQVGGGGSRRALECAQMVGSPFDNLGDTVWDRNGDDVKARP